jgi:hypothetical protein
MASIRICLRLDLRHRAWCLSMTSVQKAVEAAIRKHKGLRAAARALGINPGYLCHLKSGKRVPGPDTASRLGLQKRVTYAKD